MASESIIQYLRHGYPKYSNDGKSFRTILEYIGPYATLAAVTNKPGSIWGDYPGTMASYNFEGVENGSSDASPTHGILSITCEYLIGQADYEGGDDEGELIADAVEIDWVNVQRPIQLHPKFDKGGEFELTDQDKLNIELWKQMPDPSYKKEYQFVLDGNYSSWLQAGGGSDGTGTLSDNAKKCAEGILLGVEYYDQPAPVARRTETYVNGPGPRPEVGKKERPILIPNLPEGYEWMRNTDRSVRRGDNNKWDRDIEWIGAKKILIDSEKIYW